jgi:protein phosphatase
VLVGHTHVQFTRRFGERMVINPGSLGQSKSGDPRARFAMLQDGQIHLRALDYPVETTVGKIQSLPLPEKIKSDLATVLRTGKVAGAS